MLQGQDHRSPASARPERPAYSWRRLSRLARRSCLGLALMASLELADAANADSLDRWRVHPSVGLLESVALRIHWFSSKEELREAARKSGQSINEFGLHGFAILKRNTETNQYVCDLYVVKMTGGDVKGDRTTVFGHEVLHCFGLMHE